MLKFTFAQMDKKIIESAIKTIESEAASIAGLKDYMNESFINAVKTIYNSAGRVVITGIGKSAIVGKKIVAT